MIAGIEQMLANSGQPGLDELRHLLGELLGSPGGVDRFIDQQLLQPRGERVLRLRFGSNGSTRSVIIKRLKPVIARLNEMVVKRWLPAISLDHAGPPLLGSVTARSGECTWHVYEDLGQWELDPRAPNREQLKVAVELIARLHTGFAGHALLGEVRLHGGDLGLRFYEANVNDALAALRALQPPAAQKALIERLLERVSELQADLPRRANALAELSETETLLHGDLWAINIFAIPAQDDWLVRLIDWDHAAVGPASYDLSTFLLRFPAADRPWILELYREAVGRAGWQLPAAHDLNVVFETHEYARFANRIIWPAIAKGVDRADWGWEELAEVERWFQAFESVLPVASEVPV
jgi:thiamine kinase-like enzyme